MQELFSSLPLFQYKRNFMDPFSTMIIAAVESAKSSIVKIDTIKNTQNKQLPQGSGSGFFFSSDGYLFTNSHVIHAADKLKIMMHDGSEFDATLIGEDPDSDLAVLKATAYNYQPAKL